MSSVLSEKLKSKADDKNALFVAKLIPTVSPEKILGVRSPDLKAIAKESVREGTYPDFLRSRHYYMEEYSLHGAILGLLKFDDVNKLIDELEAFLPFIDNWAVCDGTANGLVAVKKHPEIFLQKCREWLRSDKPYTIRFGVVVLLSFYLDTLFDENILYDVLAVSSEEYYVNMAIAWFYSFALIKQYEKTLPLFVEKKIKNVWVHNKSIQKARESFRISDEKKEYLKSLKITNSNKK